MESNNKKVWNIAYPILISLLMEHLINITDTAFLGHVGEIELGASALAGVYYMAIYMLGFGFSIGIQILIARRNGEKRYPEIGKIFQQGAYFLLFLACLLIFFSKFCGNHILQNLISSTAVYEATVTYLDWRIYGLFFSFSAILFRAFYIGITETRILTLNSILMVTSNILFNYLLIFGKFGFPRLGIAGAAIGSSLAELISLLFYAIYSYIKVEKNKYRLFKRTRFNRNEFRSIWKISSWTMLQSFLFPSQWFLFFIAIEHLGERPLAIANIIRSINTCFFVLIFAFADTTSSIVSNQLGAGVHKKEIWKTCKRSIKLAYIIGIPFIALTALFPYEILRIYTDNSELIIAAHPTLYVMLGNFLLSVPGLILFNAVTGTGNTYQSMKIMLFTMLVYIIYVIVVIIHYKTDIAIGWTTEYLYSGTLFILSFLYLQGKNWNRNI